MLVFRVCVGGFGYAYQKVKLMLVRARVKCPCYERIGELAMSPSTLRVLLIRYVSPFFHAISTANLRGIGN